MRILQVCSAEALGGGEVHVAQLIDRLRNSGHRVMTAGRRKGPLNLELELPFVNALDFYTAFRIRQVVRHEAVDIVHAHVARDYPIVAAALWGLTHPKLVLTRHVRHRIKRNPLLARVDGWIAPTLEVLDSIQSLKPHAGVVIPNWVDSSLLMYQERPIENPVVVGLLGQIAPHKGHDDALEALGQLGRDFRLLIAGEGPDGYVRSLRDRARALPVDFLGFTKPEVFFGQIDLLIFPSWGDAFGLVVLEAMAAGVNVVATDVGGPPEILDRGQAGLLVPPRNPDALAQAIRRLATDESLRQRLRKSARRRVEEVYEISSIVPRIEEFYRELSE